MKKANDILSSVNKYYSGKVLEFGATAKGVDWNSVESQELRFEQLIGVVRAEQNFSLLDYGCGYGALLPYLQKKFSSFNYTGFDVSEEMLENAKKLYPAGAEWKSKLQTDDQFDYVIASGIFNVRLEHSVGEWEKYIADTLADIHRVARKGFSFNMLTSWSDKEYMKDYLYYADPCAYFDICKRNFSPQVALLHDYPLYEFAIIVRK